MDVSITCTLRPVHAYISELVQQAPIQVTFPISSSSLRGKL